MAALSSCAFRCASSAEAVASASSPLTAARLCRPKPQPDGTLVKALARAWRWQRMLDEGRFGSVRELAEAERVSLSYICRDSASDPARTRRRRVDPGRAGRRQGLRSSSSRSRSSGRCSGSELVRAGCGNRDPSGNRERDKFESNAIALHSQSYRRAVPPNPEGSLSGAEYMAPYGAARSTCAASAMIDAPHTAVRQVGHRSADRHRSSPRAARSPAVPRC